MAGIEENKDGRGGKRPGSGRKTNEEKNLPKPLVTKCFRVDEKAYLQAPAIHGKAFNQKVNDFIKRLAKKAGKGSS